MRCVGPGARPPARLPRCGHPRQSSGQVLDVDGTMEVKEVKLFGQVIRIGGVGKYGELDIKYNCHGAGVVTITVVIPFPSENFAPAIFSWRKVCGGGENADVRIATATGGERGSPPRPAPACLVCACAVGGRV